MADETYRGLLENISEASGTYKQMLQAIAEGGGGGGGGLYPVGQSNGTLDKTWREIFNAITDGKIPYLYGGNIEYNFASINYIRDAIQDDNVFYIYLVGWDDSTGYSTNSADGYPTFFD